MGAARSRSRLKRSTAGRSPAVRKHQEQPVQDPIRTKLARARVKLDAAERRNADPARSDRQRRRARSLARSWRAVFDARQKAVDLEECERQKLLKGDPSSRCMFLDSSASASYR